MLEPRRADRKGEPKVRSFSFRSSFISIDQQNVVKQRYGQWQHEIFRLMRRNMVDAVLETF